MRILLLTQFYPPIIGGEEQHVRTLGQALAARGHQVAVATLWHDGLAETELDGEVRVYRLRGTFARLSWLFSNAGRRFAPPVPDPELALALGRVVARERPEVVHAHNWLVDSFLPLKKRTRVPLVLSLHNYHRVCPTVTLMRGGEPCAGPRLGQCLACTAQHYRRLKGTATTLGHALMRPWVRAAVDMYLPVSQAVAEGNGLAAAGVPFAVVPNFIPDDLGSASQKSEAIARYVARLPKGEFVLYAGAFARLKGIEVLLRAYAGLPEVPLVLIGYHKPEEPLPSPLPPNVQVLADWPRAAVLAAWRRALFGVVPSLWAEPCPTVSLEAMACGRPVVGSAVGGTLDQIISGETGYLVPPGDVYALRAAMWDLLAHPDERARMGQAAARQVRAFRVGAVVPRIERIYEKVIAERLRPRGKDRAARRAPVKADHRLREGDASVRVSQALH